MDRFEAIVNTSETEDEFLRQTRWQQMHSGMLELWLQAQIQSEKAMSSIWQEMQQEQSILQKSVVVLETSTGRSMKAIVVDEVFHTRQ